MTRRTIEAPTQALRDAAREAGITLPPMWLCDDAIACLRRQVARDTRR